MKLNHSLGRVFIVLNSVLILGTLPAKGQDSLAQFDWIYTDGDLPSDYVSSWRERYTSSTSSGEQGGLDEDEYLDFWKIQYNAVDNLIRSGLPSFDDPLTRYLNNIKDILLKDQPALADEVRLYLFRRPSVNARSLANGVIFIHTGLLAHAQSEAEIAYVVAHEIAHHTERHLYQAFEDFQGMQGGWGSSRLDPFAARQTMLRRSRENEIEADSVGFELYQKSPYAPAAVDSVLTRLHESYITYGRHRVDSTTLSVEGHRIPSLYFRKDISPISKEEDYRDEDHSHPNIARRRAILDSLMGQDSSAEGAGQYFTLGQERFANIRRLARFEQIREYLLYGYYGDALYLIEGMERDYPDSPFLEKSRIQALFGLAGFKAIDDISEVARSTYQVEGPSQQMHHLIKQLSREQFVAVALKHTLEAKERFPEDRDYRYYARQLARYLHLHCKTDPEDYAMDTTHLPPFKKKAEDYSRRAFYRAQQEHYGDFHKYFLHEAYQSGWLKENMLAFHSERDSLARRRTMDADDREDRDEERQEAKLAKGYSRDDILFLDPEIQIINIDGDYDDYEDVNRMRREFIKGMKEALEEEGLQYTLLFSSEMEPEDIQEYNDYARLKEWVHHVKAFKRRKIKPVFYRLEDKLNLPYRYVSKVFGLVDEDGPDFYYFGLFDLKTGAIKYQRYEDQGITLRTKKMLRELDTDLEIIRR